jgi:hypothetical protein
MYTPGIQNFCFLDLVNFYRCHFKNLKAYSNFDMYPSEDFCGDFPFDGDVKKMINNV